jgi:hypothetical protein
MGAAVLEGGGEEQMTAVARHGTARLQVASGKAGSSSKSWVTLALGAARSMPPLPSFRFLSMPPRWIAPEGCCLLLSRLGLSCAGLCCNFFFAETEGGPWSTGPTL